MIFYKEQAIWRGTVHLNVHASQGGQRAVWEGSFKKERSFQTPGNTLSGRSVVSLGISEGKITRRKNK